MVLQNGTILAPPNQISFLRDFQLGSMELIETIIVRNSKSSLSYCQESISSWIVQNDNVLIFVRSKKEGFTTMTFVMSKKEIHRGDGHQTFSIEVRTSKKPFSISNRSFLKSTFLGTHQSKPSPKRREGLD